MRCVFAILPAVLFSTAISCAYLYAPTLRPNAAVVTLAGDGVAGVRDGAASQAEFVYPTAVAYDRATKSIIVVDTGAQRIRRISGSTVTTIAGASPMLASGLAATGGYADGAARRALFNDPRGVAVALDGSIYVADGGNHCIRRIAKGVVSTFAGSPSERGNSDGSLKISRFEEPRGLAIGSDGTLYVADYGVGIRLISPSGYVSTLPLDRLHSESTFSLSYWEGFGLKMLFVVSDNGVFLFNLVTRSIQNEAFGQADAPPRPYGVAGVGVHEFIASSPLNGNLVFDDFDDVRIITGNTDRDVFGARGFADGLPAVSKFCEPMGLALDPQHNVIVADACNRRIRLVPAVNARTYVGSGTPLAPLNTKVYRIAYISNSMAYDYSMWNDSIEGTIEARLNADRKRIGLAKLARVDAVKLGDTLEAQAEYIHNVLAQGVVNLVIWGVNSRLLWHNFPGTDFPLPKDRIMRSASWRHVFEEANDQLRRNGARLLVVYQPLGTEVGPSESLDAREWDSIHAPKAYRETVRVPDFAYSSSMAMEKFLRGVRVPFLGSYEAFLQRERQPHAPLYLADDFHFTPSGNQFFGTFVADYLEVARPWLIDTSKRSFASISSSLVRTTRSVASAVSTLAGDGYSGTRDGSGSYARFMFPESVAYDPGSGTIVVADSAAQRIKKIDPHGVVSTISGSGAPLPNGLGVEGGFADGPAPYARFNHPSGVAVGRGGVIYIADAFNHCIRTIAHGKVLTVAGRPGHGKPQDGTTRTATFVEPRAIAIASDGTMFVLDYTVGVRRISSDGRVSTLSIPGSIAQDARSISLWDAGGEEALFLADRTSVGRYELKTGSLTLVSASNKYGTGIYPAAVAAMSYNEAIVTSTIWNSISIVRFGDTNERAVSRIVTGARFSDESQTGGFLDGNLTAARFFAPTGITIGANQQIVIADAGNRRIRTVRMPESIAAAEAFRRSQSSHR